MIAYKFRYFILIGMLTAIASLATCYYFPPYAFGYRYYGTAYAMWFYHEFWYPVWLNGSLNVQKGPLFYWLTHLIWSLSGVNRLAMPLIIISSYLLNGYLAIKITSLFTQNKQTAVLAGLLTLLNTILLANLQLIRFDSQLSFCVLIALYALCKIVMQQRYIYWWLFALANVAGLLFKGPPILIFSISAALFAPILQPTHFSKIYLSYYLNLLFYLFISAIIFMLWLIPADFHSHHQLITKYMPQLWQRFNHKQPDPNLLSDLRPNYHWWPNAIIDCLQYIGVVLFGFVIFLPLLAMRIFYGMKNIPNKQIYFFIGILITPILFFGLFIGIITNRYIVPLIPILAIFLAYLSSAATLATHAQSIEDKIYRFLWWLFLFTWIVTLDFLIFSINMPILWPIMIASGLISFTGRWANTLAKRFNLLATAVLIFYISACITQSIHNDAFTSLQNTIAKIANLQEQHKPVYIVDNDFNQSGWAQFLARNIHLPQISIINFKHLPKIIKNQAWLIIRIKMPKNSKPFANEIYPLQFQRILDKQYRHMQILIPYRMVLAGAPGSSLTNLGTR